MSKLKLLSRERTGSRVTRLTAFLTDPALITSQSVMADALLCRVGTHANAVSRGEPSVEMSLDAAGKSARATLSLRLLRNAG